MLKKQFKIENKMYQDGDIKSAIRDFSDFDISYSAWVLTISAGSNDEIDEIFNEFMNYVVWVYNESI